MPAHKPPLLALVCLALSSAAGSVGAEPPATAGTPAETERSRLLALLDRSDEAYLDRSPMRGLLRGDDRRADRFGDMISADYWEAERRAAEADLAALRAIDRSALNRVDQVAYDMFEWDRRTILAGLEPGVLAIRAVQPHDHF